MGADFYSIGFRNIWPIPKTTRTPFSNRDLLFEVLKSPTARNTVEGGGVRDGVARERVRARISRQFGRMFRFIVGVVPGLFRSVSGVVLGLFRVVSGLFRAWPGFE